MYSRKLYKECLKLNLTFANSLLKKARHYNYFKKVFMKHKLFSFSSSSFPLSEFRTFRFLLNCFFFSFLYLYSPSLFTTVTTFLFSLACTEPATNMQHSSAAQNHIFRLRLFLYYFHMFRSKDLRDTFPGTPEPIICSKWVAERFPSHIL